MSIATVSYVLNGKRAVSSQVREQVLAASDALGYRVNSAAQTLRRQSSKTVGLCMTTVSTVYLRELANALDEIATENGYELVQVLTRQDPARELARVNSLLSRQVDGIVLLPSLHPQAALEAISRSSAPSVVVDRIGEDDRFSYVIVNNNKAMQDLVRHLMGTEHRRLLFVAQNLDVVTTRHRLAGLEEQARLAGGALRYQAIQRGDDEVAYATRLRHLLEQPDPPTAIIAGNSSVALSTWKALLAAENQQAVAMATFDDPDWADLCQPAMISVRVPFRTFAEATWELLMQQMEGRFDAARTIQIDAGLVVRM
ncbi:LacI family transcriptional regulator [Aminobacter aganoensis]|uniref:LacI family transcriptional regulator n=1 Tax=Aminobacter aganoensis TaxID=83264 RepID=A0A7X0FDS8_9HYPH|nr:LacI family transcriptional regulator [Aminobacter aganoensis]